MPIDLLIYLKDELKVGEQRRIRIATRISKKFPKAGRRRSAKPSPISMNMARTRSPKLQRPRRRSSPNPRTTASARQPPGVDQRSQFVTAAGRIGAPRRLRFNVSELSYRRVECPLLIDAFETMRATVFKLQPGPGDKVLHSARHPDLTGAGEPRYAGTGVDTDAGNIGAAQLDLRRMHAAAHVEFPQAGDVTNGTAAADSSCRSVEGRDQAITRCVDVTAAMLARPERQLRP